MYEVRSGTVKYSTVYTVYTVFQYLVVQYLSNEKERIFIILFLALNSSLPEQSKCRFQLV